MPPPRPSTTWDLDGPLGRETWIGPPGAFEHVLLDGRAISLDPANGELALLQPRPATCSHAGPWPWAFRFCPACGSPLGPPAPPPQAETWSSPPGTGLPQAACTGAPDPTGRAELAMPGPAQLDWFVAGGPSRLLAFDQISGRLHACTGLETGNAIWAERAQLPTALGLPRWSWGVAALPAGAVLPTDGGPVHVGIEGGTTAATPAPSVDGVLRCLGGAAFLGAAVPVPVWTATGLALATWWDDQARWDVLPVTDGPADELFAAPCLTAGEAFWAGRHGQLHARLQEGRLSTTYRPWPAGWQPMQAVRPVLSPNGVFHQLGRRDGRQAFEALLPPGATPQRRAFDRYVASAGSVTFMGGARHREPWEPKRVEYRVDGNSFLVPLLPFDREGALVAACSPRTALRSFIETRPDAPEPLDCRIMFAGASIVPTDLRMTVRARSATEITALVYRRTLLVYDAPANRCCTWPLRDA